MKWLKSIATLLLLAICLALPGIAGATPVGMVDLYKVVPSGNPYPYQVITHQIDVTNVGSSSGRFVNTTPFPASFIYHSHDVYYNTTGGTIQCTAYTTELICRSNSPHGTGTGFGIYLRGSWPSTGSKSLTTHADAQGSGAGYDSSVTIYYTVS